MNFQDLAESHKLWVIKNPQIASAILQRAAEAALASERHRKERSEKLLEPFARVAYGGRSHFSFKDFEGICIRIRDISGWFREWFEDKRESDVPAVELVASRILSGGADTSYPNETEIRTALGERAELYLAHIFYFLETADHGLWYCFYAKDIRGILRWLHAEWHDGWYISAVPIGYHDDLRNGGCVVHRA